MKCLKCTHEYEGKFCPKCGEKNVATCTKCGCVKAAGLDFCAECGNKFASEIPQGSASIATKMSSPVKAVKMSTAKAVEVDKTSAEVSEFNLAEVANEEILPAKEIMTAAAEKKLHPQQLDLILQKTASRRKSLPSTRTES